MSKLTQELDNTLHIYNSWAFARIGGARVYISYSHYHAGAQGYTDPRAYIMRWSQDSKTFIKTMAFRVPSKDRGTYAQTRNQSFELARAWVSTNHKVMEWSRTPYNDAWVPRTVYNRVMDKLKEAQVESQA